MKAFNFNVVHELKKISKIIADRKSCTSHSLCSIGSLDLLIPKDLSLDSLTVNFPQLFEYIINNKILFESYGVSPAKYNLIDLEFLLKSLKFDYYWVGNSLGSQKQASQEKFIKLNLNEPIYPHLYSKFDVLIDSGVVQNFLNIGQVFENYFYMLKPGGLMSQYIPCYYPNEGFWCANPTLIFDLARLNDLQIMYFELQGYKSEDDYYYGRYDRLKYERSVKFVPDMSYHSILMHYILKKKKKSIFKTPI